MDTFEKEVEFLSKEFEAEEKKWFEKPVKKTAVFKELSRTDKDQHKLHFKLLSLFKQGEDDVEAQVSPDAMYDITVKFINQHLQINEGFTLQNKTEFLNDSGAIFNFAMWLMEQKLAPFFLTLMNIKKE